MKSAALFRKFPADPQSPSRPAPASMKLGARILIMYLCIAAFVLLLIGLTLPLSLYRRNIVLFSGDSIIQMKHLDFAISNFVEELKSDIRQLSVNAEVRTREDSRFTNFLDATEESFRYSIGEREQRIIDVLDGYRSSHKYVSSVYMGRENGSFVRSHKRAQPTAYDPRTRPWYILAKENPGKVMVTEAYRSVTTPDINIGVVTALLDAKGKVFGVVGADVTLTSLTEYIASFDVGRYGQMILVDRSGLVIAARDPALLVKNIREVLGDQAAVFLSEKEGELGFGKNIIVHYTSPELGWKIGIMVPLDSVRQEISESVRTILLFVLIALVLLSFLTVLLLHSIVIRPLSGLTTVSERIAATGDMSRPFDVNGVGEIGILARSFTAMVGRIRTEEEGRQRAIAELAEHRDNLEAVVAERTRDLAVAKDAAESADRLKSAFLATMSHELRTPLNSIIGFSGILLQELAGPLNEEQKKQLSMVAASSEHLLALINDVLDISKIEAGQLELKFEAFDPRASLEKVVGAIAPFAAHKALDLRIRIDPGVGSITSDRRRFEQVLFNLLSNSVKFTETGFVGIVCSVEDGSIVVRILDSGIGIREADLDKLFKPFRQVETGLTRHYEGTGLGLSICKRLVEMMGGSIWVESEWGKGSLFGFRLPLVRGTQ